VDTANGCSGVSGRPVIGNFDHGPPEGRAYFAFFPLLLCMTWLIEFASTFFGLICFGFFISRLPVLRFLAISGSCVRSGSGTSGCACRLLPARP
jgi:hypothetical protein